MPVEVKICGLSTADALETAIDAGAATWGSSSIRRSPRAIDPEAARVLAERGTRQGRDRGPCR